MLLLVITLMAIATVVVMIRRRDILSVYICGLCGSLVVMMCGVIPYIAKMGGYNSTQRLYLFLFSSLMSWLQYLPIHLGVLGYIVALGRCLFPFFLLCIGIYYTNISWLRRHERTLHIIGALITLLFLIFYYPSVFRWIVGGNVKTLILVRKIALLWINFCIFSTAVLMIQEYFSITSPYFKRHHRSIMLAIASITGLYVMYAIQDPGQIYNFYVYEYIQIGSLHYLRTALSNLPGWIVLTGCSIFFVGFGSYSLIYVGLVNRSEDEAQIQLQRKFDMASKGASVFVHSIKNQLLSAKVIHRKLQQEFEKECISIEQVQNYVAVLCEMNQNMLIRMDELYQSVKANALALIPTSIDEIVDASLLRLHQKYPAAQVQVTVETQDMVLADKIHLAEALYNLLANAFEAVQSANKGDAGRISLRIHGERLWIDFEVKDNGNGISKAEQKKVFDPFYTSKNTNFNWGMGLYYVLKITQGHLGHLHISSKPGEGSCFLMMLPRYVSGNSIKKRGPENDLNFVGR